MVWRLLIDAENWSSYFPPEDQVKILSGESELAPGTRYSRVTVGFPMSLTVTEYEPLRRLSWQTVVDGDETGSSAYHGWVITPACHPSLTGAGRSVGECRSSSAAGDTIVPETRRVAGAVTRARR